MSRKHLLLISSLFLTSTTHILANQEAPCQKDPHNTSALLADIATMTDDIAELVITCKTEKDPKKIKVIVASLIKALMNMIETIVEKRRQKKLNRSLAIDLFDFSQISPNSLDQDLNDIILLIAQKINDKQ